MRQLLAVKLKVRCIDGSTHNAVKLYVENNRRIYVADDGSELDDVDQVEECTSVVSPLVLAAALGACKRCEQ